MIHLKIKMLENNTSLRLGYVVLPPSQKKSHPSFVNGSSRANGRSQLSNTFPEAPGSWAFVRLKFVKIRPKIRSYGQLQNMGVDFRSLKIDHKWAPLVLKWLKIKFHKAGISPILVRYQRAAYQNFQKTKLYNLDTIRN